jgi:hypothetical protein
VCVIESARKGLISGDQIVFGAAVANRYSRAHYHAPTRPDPLIRQNCKIAFIKTRQGREIHSDALS